jgi:hypothetical protein
MTPCRSWEQVLSHGPRKQDRRERVNRGTPVETPFLAMFVLEPSGKSGHFLPEESCQWKWNGVVHCSVGTYQSGYTS